MAKTAIIDLNSTTSGTDNAVNYDQSSTTNPTIDLFGSAQVTTATGGKLDSVTITASGWSGTESYNVPTQTDFAVVDDGNGSLTLTYTGHGNATDAQWTALLNSITYTNTADVSLGSTRTFSVTGSGAGTTVTGGDDMTVTCLCAGTMVATPAGEVAVEN